MIAFRFPSMKSHGREEGFWNEGIDRWGRAEMRREREWALRNRKRGPKASGRIFPPVVARFAAIDYR